MELKLLLQLLLCGFDICLFLFDRTAKTNPKEVSTCRGSFGGFESKCFQLDRAARIKTTRISYFSCNSSLVELVDGGYSGLVHNAVDGVCVPCVPCKVLGDHLRCCLLICEKTLGDSFHLACRAFPLWLRDITGWALSDGMPPLWKTTLMQFLLPLE